MRVVFWLCVGLVAYVYAGYPLLITRRRRSWEPPPELPTDALPHVSLVIAAYNEESVIEAKLRNALESDYPGPMTILVVSDGSTDRTEEIVRRFERQGVTMHALTPRGGKTQALNAVVPHVQGDIVVLSDANTMFASDAVRTLVRHFADDRVGAVSGDVRLVGSAGEYASSESLYYRYERFVQLQESRLGTVIGADGGMYAMRRALFRPIPPGIVVDDFVIAMNVARQGYQVRYEPRAIAVEAGTLSPAEEFQRKVRVIAGGIQALCSGVGLPRLSQPLLAWCYVSHKLLRWLLPCAIAGLFVASAALASDVWYRSVFLAQTAFFGLAAIHAFRTAGGVFSRLTAVPYYFCLVNAAAALGLWRGLRARQSPLWTRTRRQPA